MKVQNEEVIDVPNENLDSPKISQEKEEKNYNKNNKIKYYYYYLNKKYLY